MEHLPPDDYTVMASMLADKDVDAMLAALAAVGRRFVACRSSSPRALGADELAARAAAHFERVEVRDDPHEALALAHAVGEPVLVTGSLYLLADLAAERVRSGMRERMTVLTFALAVLLVIVGTAFAVGYILGKLLL